MGLTDKEKERQEAETVLLSKEMLLQAVKQ